MNLKKCIIIGLCVNACYINAQSLNDTIKIAELTVIENAKPLILSETPINVVEINRATIEHSNASNILPVLTKNVSGLFTTAKGIMGYGISTNATGTINIHGVGQGNKILTMIDGVPNWAGIFGHSIADNWTSSNVQSIEVVKGPSSLYYGSNAMGGTINVITRKQNNDG